VPRYRPSFSEADFDRLMTALEQKFRGEMSFDTNEAAIFAFSVGATKNVGDIAAILDDLADLGIVRRLRGEPTRWQWIG
jgi:hypothetical protein